MENIELKRGAIYTNNRTDLAFKVHNIFYSNKVCVKVKGTLFIKKSGYILEGPKGYTLYYDRISDWLQTKEVL